MVWYETKEGRLINLDRFDGINMRFGKEKTSVRAVLCNNMEVTLFIGTKEECKEELERIKIKIGEIWRRKK